MNLGFFVAFLFQQTAKHHALRCPGLHTDAFLDSLASARAHFATVSSRPIPRNSEMAAASSSSLLAIAEVFERVANIKGFCNAAIAARADAPAIVEYNRCGLLIQLKHLSKA